LERPHTGENDVTVADEAGTVDEMSIGEFSGDLGMRVTYLASTPPDTTRGPECDFAVPLGDHAGADAVA
jgi:hypothetical protein